MGTKSTGRLLVMGDIHGHYDKMQMVLKNAKYDSKKDQLILLGDYVDRGPNSSEVVEAVKNLVKDGAVALYGNHEDMMCDVLINNKSNVNWFYNEYNG